MLRMERVMQATVMIKKRDGGEGDRGHVGMEERVMMKAKIVGSQVVRKRYCEDAAYEYILLSRAVFSLSWYSTFIEGQA